MTSHAICRSYMWTGLVEAQVADQAKVDGNAAESALLGLLLEAKPSSA